MLKCIVLSNKFITPTVFELKFETEPKFQHISGQFISIVIPGAGPKGRDLRRAYSIASNPEINPIELCIKLVEKGPGTNYLVKLKPGDIFQAQAPFGDFVFKTPSHREAVFLATGTGIAPFRAMLSSDQYKKNPALKAKVLFGVRTEDELLYLQEFKDKINAQLILCVSRPMNENWDGYKGRVSRYLKEFENEFNFQNSDFYMCGNGEMILEVKEFLQTKNVPKDSIHLEKYY